MALSETELLSIQEKICSFGSSYDYTLTPAEMGWIDFVRGRYSIVDYLDQQTIDTVTIDDIECYVVRLDFELSEALDDDNKGAGKAACLSDDTDLQAIFFYCYTETDNE